jgi:hypothetical protein
LCYFCPCLFLAVFATFVPGQKRAEQGRIDFVSVPVDFVSVPVLRAFWKSFWKSFSENDFSSSRFVPPPPAPFFLLFYAFGDHFSLNLLFAFRRNFGFPCSCSILFGGFFFVWKGFYL